MLCVFYKTLIKNVMGETEKIFSLIIKQAAALNCPRLSRQYKNSLIGRKIKFKQQTDFAFQAESVLF